MTEGDKVGFYYVMLLLLRLYVRLSFAYLLFIVNIRFTNCAGWC